MSMNLVVLVGNIGSDPDLHYTQSGSAIARVNVATNRTHRKKNGELQTETTWHRVVMFGKTAENAAKYLKKGDEVQIQGHLSNSSFTTKEGQKVTKTEIIVDDLRYGSRSKGHQQNEQRVEEVEAAWDGGDYDIEGKL